MAFKQPIYYMQTDSRWKNYNYSAKGESTTIGRAGCGPTSAAMVIASLKDGTVTPVTCARWSLDHGYKALRSGTYYSYFVPQMKAYNINCRQLNQINNWHHNDQAKLRASVTNYLKNGSWIIACMGKGTWTSSGHYVLAWGASGNTVYVNDPYSKASNRTKGNLNTFLNEAKYFWLIEGVAPVTPKKDEKKDEDEEMTQADFNKMFAVAMNNYMSELAKKAESSWSTTEGYWKKAQNKKGKNGKSIVDGSNPQGNLTREQMTAILGRLGLLD